VRSWTPVVVLLLLVAAGCGSESSSTDDSSPPTAVSTPVAEEQRFPDVIAAVATAGDVGWDFDVTVSSPYDTPERYADAWRVVGPDGTVFGVRELLHDHASEQPFTRSLQGVAIPAGVDVVVVEGRDLANGWGGGTVELVLDRA